MKIPPPASPIAPRRVAPARRTAAMEGASTALKAPPPDAAVGAAPAAPVNALSHPQAVFALQGEAPDAREEAARGAAMLDALDALQQGLLTSRGAGAEVSALQHLVLAGRARDRSGALDGDLAALMRAIELRAAVELAKRGRDVT